MDVVELDKSLRPEAESLPEDILTDSSLDMISPSTSDIDEPISSKSSLQENETESVELYEVKASPGKGMGVFATTHITRGTIIIEEPPLIRIKRQTWVPKEIKRLVSDLPDDAYHTYMSLHSIHGLIESYPISTAQANDFVRLAREKGKWKSRKKEVKSSYSIWVSNCMAAGDCDAVFHHISRINHTCVPNATFVWNGAKSKQEIRAVKDIPAGEEITISYFNFTIYNKAQREDALMKQYNFKCSCIACKDLENSASFAAKSHWRRWQLAQLHGIDSDDLPIDLKISNCNEEIQLLEEEGIYDPALGKCYLFLSRYYMKAGRKSKALSAANKAYEIHRNCYGDEATFTVDLAKSLKEIEDSKEEL